MGGGGVTMSGAAHPSSCTGIPTVLSVRVSSALGLTPLASKLGGGESKALSPSVSAVGMWT